MLGLAPFLVFVFAAGVLQPAILAQGPAGAKLLLADDFTKDSLASYHSTGDVQWAPHTARLVAKSAISKSLAMGTKVNVTIDVEEDSSSAVGDINFQVTFSFEKSTAGVIVTRARGSTNTVVHIIGRHYDRQQVLRSFDLTEGTTAKWNVSLNYGVVMMARNGKLVAGGYADVGYRTPSAITFGTTAGAVLLHSVSVQGINSPIPAEIEAKGKAILDSANHDLLYREGHVKEALEAALRQVYGLKQLYGEDSPQVAAILQNIGVYRSHLGDIPLARQEIETALRIAEKTFGEQHPDTAANLSALGNLLAQEGDFEAALVYYRRVLAITEGILGPDDPRTGMAYSYIGGLLGDLGRWSEAAPYLQKRLDVYKQMFPEGDRHVATSMIQLGDALAYTGKLREGQKLIEEALQIYKKQLDPKNIEIARTENVLGHVLARQHEYAQALDHFQMALALCREVLGSGHRNTAIVLSNVAHSLALQGKTTEAHAALQEAFDVKIQNGAELIGSVPDAEALAYINTVRGYRDGLISMDWGLDRVSASELYDHAVKARGMLDEYLYGRIASGEAPDPTLYHDPKPGSEDRRIDLLPRFIQEKERLQRELRNSGHPARSGSVDQRPVLTRVAQLPADTAIVEIVRVEGQFRSTGDRLPPSGSVYVGFVTRSTASGAASVEKFVFGSADDLDGALTEWRDSLRKRSASIEEINHTGKLVRRLAWDPIKPFLNGIRRIVIIPDGALARIPWGALPADDSGSAFLIDSYTIGTASSSREALTFLDLNEPKGTALLTVGNLDYGPKRPTTPPGGGQNSGNGRFNMHSWEPLTETRSEIALIAALRRGQRTVSLSAKGATKISLQKEIGRARYVHLSTHGFFADATVRSALQIDGKPLNPDDEFAEFDAPGRVLGRDPMLLSGIVLSNANVTDRIVQTSQGFEVENGLLTAEEVLGLPLHGTELVVLSACETGLGEVAGGEGVFGLQRAFALAGARMVVASLWKVDSKVTSILMQQFYRNLWLKHMPKLEALRAAQLEVMNRYDEESGKMQAKASRTASPFYWASFVSYGDWK